MNNIFKIIICILLILLMCSVLYYGPEKGSPKTLESFLSFCSNAPPYRSIDYFMGLFGQASGYFDDSESAVDMDNYILGPDWISKKDDSVLLSSILKSVSLVSFLGYNVYSAVSWSWYFLVYFFS